MTHDDLVIADERIGYKILPSKAYPGKWRVFRMERVGHVWTVTGGRPPATRLVCESEAEARAAAEQLAYGVTMEHVKSRAALVPYRADESDEDYYRRVAMGDFE